MPSKTLIADIDKTSPVLLEIFIVIDLDANDKKDDSLADVPPPEGGEKEAGGCNAHGRTLTERGTSDAPTSAVGEIGRGSDRRTVTLIMQCGGWPMVELTVYPELQHASTSFGERWPKECFR